MAEEEKKVIPEVVLEVQDVNMKLGQKIPGEKENENNSQESRKE